MKKKSIKQWSTLWFTVILLLALAVSAGWNYYWTERSAIEQADQHAETCGETISQMLDEWNLDELSQSNKTKLYQKARETLRRICQRYHHDYLYVFTIDPRTNARHYILCVADDDESDQIVLDERNLGSISDEPLDRCELAIMAGASTMQKEIMSSRYGHEVTWLLPYLNDDGSLRAIIGLDYSVQMQRRKVLYDFLLGIVPVVLALGLGFVIQLILLQKRITNPIHAISDSMHRFSQNSSVKPAPLGINTQDEIGEIASSYEKMTEEISTYIGNIEALTRERVETNIQLDIARRIQNGFVPEKTNLCGNGFSCSALTRPARAVGGDFYDCFKRDEKTACIVMGDVSGKGLTAAIFMTVVKTMIREKLRACLGPAQALNEVNDELCSQNPVNLFATVFAGTLDLVSGRLCYANAGHTHPVILGAVPSYLVPDNGIALGLFEDAGLKDSELVLKPGEGILLYTDGITEAVNPEKQFFGEKRLLCVLSGKEEKKPDRGSEGVAAVSGPGSLVSEAKRMANAAGDEANASGVTANAVEGTENAAEAVVNRVRDAVETFCEGYEPFDDAAVLVLLRNNSRQGFLSLPVALSSFEEVRRAVFDLAGDTCEARQFLLACDEALANIVSYSGAESLEFTCTREGGHLVIIFSDDGIPFDPTAEKPKEKDFDLLDSGGMGLSLIRQNVSSLSYERKNGRNELTMRFDL